MARFATFKVKHRFVPSSYQGILRFRKHILSPFRSGPSKYRFHPSIFPSQLGWLETTLQFRSQALQLLNKVQPIRIEVMVPILQISETGSSNTFAIFKRTEGLNVNSHRL